MVAVPPLMMSAMFPDVGTTWAPPFSSVQSAALPKMSVFPVFHSQ